MTERLPVVGGDDGSWGSIIRGWALAELLTKITSYEAQFARGMFVDGTWYTMNVGGARVHSLLVSLGI